MNILGDLLKHILVPMVTPFKRGSQDLDYAAAEKLADHLISKRLCDSILVAGTTGEFHTMTAEERLDLLRAVHSVAQGRCPLVAGTGAASTRETIRLTQAAQEIGYDCAMIVTPYYCRPTQEGLYAHYEAVARATDLPIMLYNIPIFSGVNLEPQTVARLAEIENVRGIKDEAGINPTQMTSYARVCPDDFTIYNGDDIMILCGMVQGAAGVISGGAHLLGDRIRRMIELFLAGKPAEAREIHHALDPFFKSLAPPDGVNPIGGLKAAIEMGGLSVGPPRLPLTEASSEHRAVLKEHLKRLGVVS